jgi:hypothetical protein
MRAQCSAARITFYFCIGPEGNSIERQQRLQVLKALSLAMDHIAGSTKCVSTFASLTPLSSHGLPPHPKQWALHRHRHVIYPYPNGMGTFHSPYTNDSFTCDRTLCHCTQARIPAYHGENSGRLLVCGMAEGFGLEVCKARRLRHE